MCRHDREPLRDLVVASTEEDNSMANVLTQAVQGKSTFQSDREGGQRDDHQAVQRA